MNSAARTILTVMLFATLAGGVSASAGIGISPPERRVRISGAGNATALFLLFNPTDRAQRFAVLLPDKGITVEPAEGTISAGGMQQLAFIVTRGNVTLEPRITMHPADIRNPRLTSGITAKIIVEPAENATLPEKGGKVTGMAVSASMTRKSRLGALLTAGLLPIGIGGLWLRKRKVSEDG